MNGRKSEVAGAVVCTKKRRPVNDRSLPSMLVCEELVSEGTQLDCAIGDRGCVGTFNSRQLWSRHAPFQCTLRGCPCLWLCWLVGEMEVLGKPRRLFHSPSMARPRYRLWESHSTNRSRGEEVSVCLRSCVDWPEVVGQNCHERQRLAALCNAIACNLLLQVKTSCRSTR
jgi:hypothetical protein